MLVLKLHWKGLRPRLTASDRCGTIKIPPNSKAISNWHRPRFRSLSPVTSPNERKFFERDLKLQTKKEATKEKKLNPNISGQSWIHCLARKIFCYISTKDLNIFFYLPVLFTRRLPLIPRPLICTLWSIQVVALLLFLINTFFVWICLIHYSMWAKI